MAADAVVLIDGNDPTLVSEAVTAIVADLVGSADRSLAVEDHGGEELDLAAVADGCATPPFLVDRRVVVVRDIGRFSAEEVAPLLAYLDDPLPSTALVLVAGGGQITPKLAAKVKSSGRVIPAKVESRQPWDWARQRLQRAPVRLDGAAEAVLRDHLGEDVSRVVPLIDLLVAAYGEGATLGADEIAPYLGEAGSVTPWAFTDAIDSGQTEAALRDLRRLLGSGERHPLEVLAILRTHVQSRLKVDSPAIRNEAQAADAMGIAKGRSTFPAKKALATARRWGSDGVAEAVSLVAEAEVNLKGAIEWPAEAVLEVLVARLCRLARAPTQAGTGRRSGSGPARTA
jgi:DNA polymerase-3 subunit delta